MNITGLRKVLELSQEIPVEQRRRTPETETRRTVAESVISVSKIARVEMQRSSDKQRNWRREPDNWVQSQNPSEAFKPFLRCA